MNLSVLIRNKNDKNIIRCISSFESISKELYELVIIDSSEHPLDISELRVNALYKHGDATRFEALALGLALSNCEKILILDSDQIITLNLIEKLNSIENDMCIIGERSLNRNFIGRLADMQREFLYEHSKQNISESLPVIPRLYKKTLIQDAIRNFGEKELSAISQHEDSVIYSEALTQSRDVAFCDLPIFNVDPPFFEFAKKSFRYGASQARALTTYGIRPKTKKLLKAIDRNRIIYSKTQGFNKGIFYDICKAIFYISGFIIEKISVVI